MILTKPTSVEEVLDIGRAETSEAMDRIMASDGFVTSERAERVTRPIWSRLIEEYVAYRLEQTTKTLEGHLSASTYLCRLCGNKNGNHSASKETHKCEPITKS